MLGAAPAGTRLRLERLPGPGWHWLERIDRVDGVMLPPPVFGLAESWTDALATEASAYVKAAVGREPAPLVTASPEAAGWWQAQGLGPATILGDVAPRLGEKPDAARRRALLDQASLLIAPTYAHADIAEAKARQMTLRVIG